MPGTKASKQNPQLKLANKTPFPGLCAGILIQYLSRFVLSLEFSSRCKHRIFSDHSSFPYHVYGFLNSLYAQVFFNVLITQRIFYSFCSHTLGILLYILPTRICGLLVYLAFLSHIPYFSFLCSLLGQTEIITSPHSFR